MEIGGIDTGVRTGILLLSQILGILTRHVKFPKDVLYYSNDVLLFDTRFSIM